MAGRSESRRLSAGRPRGAVGADSGAQTGTCRVPRCRRSRRSGCCCPCHVGLSPAGWWSSRVILGVSRRVDGGDVQYRGRGEQRHGAFGEVAAVAACHSSWMSARTAPTRRMTAASLGKIPTTRARRLISLLSRSSGLSTRSSASGSGERGEGEDFGFGVVHQRADLREPVGELVADLVPGRGDGGRVGLGEDGAEHRGDHVLMRLGHQGEQVAGEVDPAALVRRRPGSSGAGRRPGRRAGRRSPAAPRPGRGA